MKFAQIIEFTTERIDEFNAGLDEWMARSDGHRIPHRAVLRRDPDAPDQYLLMVEFASYEQGMENSGRPETGEFAAFPGRDQRLFLDVPQSGRAPGRSSLTVY